MMEKEEGQRALGGKDMDMGVGGHNAGTRREFLWQEPRLWMEELGNGTWDTSRLFLIWDRVEVCVVDWWRDWRSETGDWRSRWS